MQVPQERAVVTEYYDIPSTPKSISLTTHIISEIWK